MPKGIPGELTIARRLIAGNKELREVLGAFAREAAARPQDIGDNLAVAIARAYEAGERAGVSRAQDRISGVVQSLAFELRTAAGNA